MPSNRSDLKLAWGMLERNFHKVKAALEAGANVNGSPALPVPPIVAAAIANHTGILDLLLQRGANPEKPVTLEVPLPNTPSTTNLGERALHLAARRGNVEIVRLLLQPSRSDPNATDSRGCTPLMATCESQHVDVEVVPLLLEAGADPTLADENDFAPLHLVALNGHMDLVDMLHSRAPAMLNSIASNGMTPLFVACSEGRESMVSKLLSLGAMQQLPLHTSRMCPLIKVAEKGLVGKVRVLINEGGIRAVGGKLAVAQALQMALQVRHARVLRLLLTVNGEELRSTWANVNIGARYLLHYGAGYCCPAAVSVLLEAGADETLRDSEGRIPRDAIGVGIVRDAPQIRRCKVVAIRRMLQRGPAYRARSWAWPSDGEADDGSSDDGDTAGAAGGGAAAAAVAASAAAAAAATAAAAAAAAAASAVLSSPPDMRTPAVIGVRIFRPREESRNDLFARLVGRYSAKG